jgi:hypothetical protein
MRQPELDRQRGALSKQSLGSQPSRTLIGGLVLLLATTTVAVLAASPIASAKPGYIIFPAERSSRLVVPGTQGFKVTIERIGGRVELTASSQEGSAIYVIRPVERPADRIEATFPGLGRVSVRFQPSGEPHLAAGFCKRRGSIEQSGTFRGTISFEGEQGFTKVAASHARGYVYRSFKEVCKVSGHATDTPGYSLTAIARSSRKQIAFNTFRATDSVFGDDTLHFVSLAEKRLGMLIARVAFARGQASSFVIEGPSARPDSAAVMPPSPFSGTASFRASGGMIEWQGTLAVNLPGAGTVQLTGPSYRSKLCLNKRCLGNIPAVPMATRSRLFAGKSHPLLSEMMTEDTKFALGF